MLFIPVKTPYLFRWFFSKYTWKKPSDKKVLYLTFDDGPTPEITTWVLRELDKYNAKTTFFCVGANIKKHSDIFIDIQEKGHLVANHTYSHVQGWQTKTKTYIDEVEKTQRIIEKYKIENSTNSTLKKLFRPPFGKIKNAQGKVLLKRGYEIIMWSVLTFDWETNITPKQCLTNSLKASYGDIIVFHDSHKASNNIKYVLPRFLEHYTNKGYTFKTL